MHAHEQTVAIITGAGGSLGRAHARALAGQGMALVLNDLTDPHEITAEITAAGGRAVGVAAGVDTPGGAQQIIDAAMDAYGRIDVVVNNAGILRDKSFGKMTPDMVTDVLGVHLHGAFHVTRAAWAALRESGGSVIMTSSGSGLYGNFGQANYAAAKLGLVGLARTLAIEGARDGVRVNAIAPLARSQMTEDVLPPELLQRLDPEWVSPLVAWLASPGCAETGNIYSVGGGRYARVGLIEGPGVSFERVPAPADLAAAAEQLNSLAGGSEPRSLTDQVQLLTT